MEREDWPGAVHWYTKAAEATENGLHTWFDLAVTWHLLTARSLCPEPAVITAADLRDPWQCYRNELLEVLKFHGAVSTAVALRRLGPHDLADRFAAWYYANDTVDQLFVRRLAAAGFSPTSVESNDDLDTLVDEVLELADRLDGIEPAVEPNADLPS
jgi:hypothetical protein